MEKIRREKSSRRRSTIVQERSGESGTRFTSGDVEIDQDSPCTREVTY
jgi:hypothetical protein